MKAKLLVLLFTLAVVSTSYGSKKTAENGKSVVNLNQVPATDYGMMIVAKMQVKPDKVKDFIEAAKEMIEKSNKEPGCKSYQLYQDPYNNAMFVFVEEYKNQAAIDAHFASDYFKAFGPRISDMIAEQARIKIISVAKETIK
jgi:quinol monooxygenase YgiN